MKICQINNLYKPYSRGGADRIVEILHEGLKKQGHEVFVVSTQADKKAYQENGNYYLKSAYARLSGLPKFLRAFFVLADLLCTKNYFRIKKILQNEKVDLVITHNLRGIGFMSVRALKKYRHVHVLHDIQLIHPTGLLLKGEEKKIENIFSRLYAYLTKKIIASPNYIVSPSAWLMQEHLARGFFQKSKTLVMPNPADISEKAVLKSRTDDKINFLYVGEIEKHKGIFLLIEAFLACHKYYDNICLDIIGKGTGAGEIPRLPNINYLGWQTKDQVAKKMADSDCLVMPSLCYENSPTVMYEAATHGLPVIAARIGGASELSHYLGGLSFSAGDASDLEKKMIYAIKNLRILENIGEESREKIKKYSTENYLKDFSEKIIV